MSDLEKIFATAGVTIVGGVLVYVVGQLASKIFIEPAQEVRKAIAQVRIVLAVHAPTIHTPVSRSRQTSEAAAAGLRACSAELFARVHAIPGYSILSVVSLRFLPEMGRADDAVKQLRGLATYVFDDEAKASSNLETIRKIVARIEADLGLEPLA